MRPDVTIINYQPVHHEAFRQLNVEWLKAYDLLEDHDLMVLNDPKALILDKGGVIFLASTGGKIVGSAALIRSNEKEYELAKMAVDEALRGKGIGRMLLEQCLSHARLMKARKIILFSNHQLKAALALYEKYGFRHVTVKNSPFETADVRMECIL
ncbi:MAG: GNAT family N-acetyltransferase [Flavisolibacter sp.]